MAFTRKTKRIADSKAKISVVLEMITDCQKIIACAASVKGEGVGWINREFKHDVYGRRQTAKITSDSFFFTCNPLNYTTIEKIVFFSPQIQIFSLYCTDS